MRHLIIILIMLASLNSFGQSEKVLIINGDAISLLHPDTLLNYSTAGNFKGFGISHSDTTISFNFGKKRKNPTLKLTRTQYDNFLHGRKSLGNCTPCWLKTYDIFTGKLIYEGHQYTDARIGNFITYYDNGKIKEQGSYGPKLTGGKTKFAKVGIWIYYKKNGKLKKRDNHDL